MKYAIKTVNPMIVKSEIAYDDKDNALFVELVEYKKSPRSKEYTFGVFVDYAYCTTNRCFGFEMTKEDATNLFYEIISKFK